MEFLLQTLEENDKIRSSFNSSECVLPQLYTLSDNIDIPQNDFKLPIFTPRDWCTRGTLPTQAVYNAKILTNLPFLEYVFPHENIIIAGGSTGAFLNDSAFNDVDFFIVGDNPTEEHIWDCANHIYSQILKWVSTYNAETRNSKLVDVKISTGVITLRFCNFKVQIILRAFRNIAQVLHGFDVPSSSVGFDGQFTFFTKLSLISYKWNVNVVWVKYASTTYELRLVKYFMRGFALLMPHFNAALFDRDGQSGDVCSKNRRELMLSNKIVLKIYGSKLGYAIGAIMYAGKIISDYDDTSKMSECYANVHQIATNGNRFTCSINSRSPIQLKPMQLNEIMSKSSFMETVYFILAKLVNTNGMINIKILKEIFKVPTALIAELIDPVYDAIKSGASRITLKNALTAFVENLSNMYDKRASEPFSFVIMSDPSSQHTVSLNPINITPKEWYGASYCDIMLSPTTYHTMPAKSTDQPTDDKTCALCLAPTSNVNVVILPCRHVFHMTYDAETECGGFIEVVKTMDGKCPTCRTKHTTKPSIKNRKIETHEITTTSVTYVI